MRAHRRCLELLPQRLGFAFAGLLLACAIALGQPQRTDQTPNAIAQSPRSIEVNLIGSVVQFDALESLIPEWFLHDGLRVVTRHQARLLPEDILATTSEGNAVRVWLTMVNSRQARAYFSDSTTRRYLMRDVPLPSGLDELGREQLVQVLVSSAQAFAAHRAGSSAAEVASSFESQAPIGTLPTSTAASLPTPPLSSAQVTAPPPMPLGHPIANTSRAAAPVSSTQALLQPRWSLGHSSIDAVHAPISRPRARWFPRFGALFGASLQNVDVAQYGPGLLSGVRRTSANSTFSLTAKGQYLHAGDAKREHLIIAAETVALRLTLATEFWTSRPFQLGVELGGGVDRVSFTTQIQPGAGLSARGPSSDWRSAALAALTGSTAYENWRLTLAAGVTTSLVKVHYDVMLSAQQQKAYVPWLVQPGLTVEASWQ